MGVRVFLSFVGGFVVLLSCVAGFVFVWGVGLC